jgi:hypothetical protein
MSIDITPQDIQRFQQIWREEFGEEISANEARLRIMKLDELYKFLYGK